MFEDFQKTKRADGRRRFGSSMAVAVILYGALGVVVVSATATARRASEEKLTQVEFAPPPEPKVEPAPEPTPAEPPPPVEKKARPKVKRPELAPPDVVPDEKPKQSDAALVAADAPGPLDGFTDGVKDGVGNAPAPPAPRVEPPAPPKPEPIRKPSELSGNKFPRFPSAASRAGVDGTVVVEFTVLPSGHAIEPKILSGPVLLHEAVLEAVPSWRFEPATQGGKKIPFRMTKKITFRLEDAE
jgi:protein TonB